MAILRIDDLTPLCVPPVTVQARSRGVAQAIPYRFVQVRVIVLPRIPGASLEYVRLGTQYLFEGGAAQSEDKAYGVPLHHTMRWALPDGNPGQPTAYKTGPSVGITFGYINHTTSDLFVGGIVAWVKAQSDREYMRI